jgi:tetratricopeptide (TPR) repeat protein
MNVSRSEATVEELFQLLPDLEELETLRLAVVATAIPDPDREWDSSTAYSTIDKRIITPDRIESALDASEEALASHISAIFQRIRPLLRSFWSGSSADSVAHLIDLGDHHEQTGLFRKARQCYDVALALSLPLTEKRPQILALRRIARVALSLGDLQAAWSYYQRSAELAQDSGDFHGEIIARTGLGNVRLWQGRWIDAENSYRTALAIVPQAQGDEVLLECAQLYNNLGTVATRQRHLRQAEEWFDKAFALWEVLLSPFDLAVYYHNRALLLEAQGQHKAAREMYYQALDLPTPPGVWSATAIDLAESYLRDGHVSRAEELGRAAEERAISARSPYFLGRMYQGRGNIARAIGDDGGFIFYEKALQIARDKGYPLLEGETLIDYAFLRAQTGGTEEAEAYLERAREIFEQLDAGHELARAEGALRELKGGQEHAATAD